MASLALAIAAGSAALVGGVMTAKQVEQSPVPAPVPTVPAPEVHTSVLPPAPEPAPEPAEPVEQAGGAVGRPPWGVISSSVKVPVLPGSTVDAVTAALGIQRNPKELQQDISTVTEQYEDAILKARNIAKQIETLYPFYTTKRTDYAKFYSESKDAESAINIYTKKITSQGQQKKKDDPEIVALANRIKELPNGPEKTRLEQEKQAKLQNVPATDDQIGSWRTIIRKATIDKFQADDEAENAKREKDKLAAEITALRAKQDEYEKQAKELKVKIEALLVQLKTILTSQEPRVPLAADWSARTARYAAALKRHKLAESNLRQFYAEVYKPLDNKPELQSRYQDKLDALDRIYRETSAELSAAKQGLTSTGQKTVTTAAGDFQQFVASVTDITRDATDSSGNIKAAYASGYPVDVKKLKDYAAKLGLQGVADVYYEISGLDTATLAKNSQKYIDFFNRIRGTYNIAAEKFGVDFTRDILKKFVSTGLERGENAIRVAAPAIPEPNLGIYTQLRKETGVFVDKQIYAIKKMMQLIRKARREAPPSQLTAKNLAELDSIVIGLFTVPAGVPPMGMCQRIFKDDVYATLSSRKFKGVDIMSILTDGGDAKLKEEFLKYIGFMKVSNFRDALDVLRQQGIGMANVAPGFIKTSALSNYIERFEQLVREDPNGTLMNQGEADNVVLAFTAPLVTSARIVQLVNGGLTFPVLGGRGAGPISNTQFLEMLRDAAQAYPFQPGVYLEAYRFPVDAAGQPLLNRARVKTVEPIANFKEACEIDANVGHGKANIDNITGILEQVEQMEIDFKLEKSPFEELIVKLEKERRIDMTREDQAQPVDILSNKGFVNQVGNGVIMKVVSTKEKKDLNFLQTFLTFRSSKFRTIPYTDTIVYKGRTENTREVYAKLFMAELEKTSYFEERTKEQKDAFPSDEDWQRISGAYNVNFILFKEPTSNSGRGTADLTAAQRQNAPVYSVFKTVNGRYFPIRIQQPLVGVPGAPPGIARGPVANVLPPLLGGALDGPYFAVEGEENPIVVEGRTKAKKEADAKAKAEAADKIAKEKAQEERVINARRLAVAKRDADFNTNYPAPKALAKPRFVSTPLPAGPAPDLKAQALNRLESIKLSPQTVAEQGTQLEQETASSAYTQAQASPFAEQGTAGLGGRRKPSRYTRRKI